MNLKKLVVVSALSVGVTVAWSSANATTYVSEGTSFASVTSGLSAERSAGGSFEYFTRSMAARQQSGDGAQGNASQEKPPGVSKDDTWLMLLIGSGLVALQLRRKQKSLPHQPLSGLAAE